MNLERVIGTDHTTVPYPDSTELYALDDLAEKVAYCGIKHTLGFSESSMLQDIDCPNNRQVTEKCQLLEIAKIEPLFSKKV